MSPRGTWIAILEFRLPPWFGPRTNARRREAGDSNARERNASAASRLVASVERDDPAASATARTTVSFDLAQEGTGAIMVRLPKLVESDHVGALLDLSGRSGRIRKYPVRIATHPVRRMASRRDPSQGRRDGEWIGHSHRRARSRATLERKRHRYESTYSAAARAASRWRGVQEHHVQDGSRNGDYAGSRRPAPL